MSDTLTTGERWRRLQGTDAFSRALLDRGLASKTPHATSVLYPYTSNLVFIPSGSGIGDVQMAVILR